MNMIALTQDGAFQPDRIAATFLTTQDDIARSAGLGRDAIQRRDRLMSAKTQTRLREMIEVLNRLNERFETPLVAYAWYRSVPLPGWGAETAMSLVKQGRADAVMTTLDALDAGAYQ
jgi:uncharacterized protein (DUF2384 family)